VLAAACDIDDTQHRQRTLGPAVSILGSNVDGTGATLPADGVIQLSFDRYLLPSTIVRQSYVVVDAANEPIKNLALRTIYDPIARTVAITGPDGPGRVWLTPGAFYRLVVLAAAVGSPSDIGGFRAIDRSPLAATREFLFRAEAATGQLYERDVNFCNDVLPIFTQKCASCHGPGATALAGLVLTTPEGLRVTARGRVAQGSNTGALAGSPGEQGPVFGINMPIIKPNDPGSSWLMYKVELAPHPVVDAGPPASRVVCDPTLVPPREFSPIAPFRAAALDDERAILSDYILGREMPYPATTVTPETQPLTFQERERIRIWIANGANVTDCKCETRAN
jgi:hypothetical protein